MNNRITFYLDDEQFNFVKNQADRLRLSRSDIVRLSLQKAIEHKIFVV